MVNHQSGYLTTFLMILIQQLLLKILKNIENMKTLKKLIQKYTPEQVSVLWGKKDSSWTTDNATSFIKETYESLNKQVQAEDKYDFLLQEKEGDFGGEKYIHVSLINPKYVEDPDPSLRVWGGNSEDRNDCKEGSYNCNWVGYQKYFAPGPTWNEFIESEIIIDKTCEHLTEVEVLAEILWEITFYGSTQEKVEEFFNALER